MDTSPRFALPLIMAAQAQKHLTHNEAMVLLETLVQPVVTDIAASEPPAEPQDAQCVIVGAGATGDFAGQDGALAAYVAQAWHIYTPQEGWLVVRADTGAALVYQGGAWVAQLDASLAGGTSMLGVNATASPSNRLTVSSDATLLTAETADHRLTLNKTAPGDTASLLFQSGWTGHAEMGLAGHNSFVVKVSDDGASWHEALVADAGSGIISQPLRPIAQAYLDGGAIALSAADEVGFAGLSVQQGAVALGPALSAPATGAPLTVPADGVYRIALTLKATALGDVSVLSNSATVVFTFSADVASAGGASVHASALVSLLAGDALSLRFDDAANITASAQTSFLEIVRL